MNTPFASPGSPRPRWSWLWAVVAMATALAPLTPGLSGSRIFYIRDLSLYFWGRYLWLRHAWQQGAFPFWDPYVGAGQAAVADALHQMFLLPAVLVRLVGSDVLGFNLWVLVPFPLAALGTWLFLARRFSAPAAALGAIAYSLSGPIYSTANFPNMSWTVAALPWVVWSADRLLAAPSARGVGLLALLVAMEACAGEPVTFVATLLLVGSFAVTIGGLGGPGGAGGDDAGAGGRRGTGDRLRRSLWVVAGVGLGGVLASVQLVPMMAAAAASDRAHNQMFPLFWSLHPVALLDTVAPKLFGDYFVSQSMTNVPWLPILNSGREPFFFSLYLGVPLLTLALLGLLAGGPRRWSTFWSAAAVVALVCAFGAYTPIYPWLRTHISTLQSFRFPAKYAVIAGLAVAALAAAGWDALQQFATSSATNPAPRRLVRALKGAAATAGLAAVVAYGAVAACLYLATPTAFRLFAIARGLGSSNPIGAAEYMLKALPDQAMTLFALAAVTALVFAAAAMRQAWTPVASLAIFALIAGDLVVRAWPVNPVFDAAWLGQPVWVAHAAADPQARFYIGGKREGTLDVTDPDASRGFLNPPGLIGSASRAALNGQTAFYPSAWQRREMLSYDLSVLWPAEFDIASKRFLAATSDERDRFLHRTGVRYRILPKALAGERTPLVQMPYYVESYLYDWDGEVRPRATIASTVRVEPDTVRQLDALFGPDDIVVAAEPPVSGRPGAPQVAGATIVDDGNERVVVDAAVDAGGGYLVLLDTFDAGWQARVDDLEAPIVRANGLFRAVRLAPGRHRVEFTYRPALVAWSGRLSALVLLLVIGLIGWPAMAAIVPGGRRRSRWSRADASALPSASIPQP